MDPVIRTFAKASKNAEAAVEERPFQGRVCARTRMPFRARGRFSSRQHDPLGAKAHIIDNALTRRWKRRSSTVAFAAVAIYRGISGPSHFCSHFGILDST